MEKEGKLKRVPFAGRDQMKKLVDPVMAAYAKEIGAEQILAKINASSSGPKRRRRPRRRFYVQKITFWYSRLLSWLLVASVAILIIPVSLQIFSRYTALIPSYIWTEEMARFCFIWSIMLGAMLGIREGTHFVVDLWPPLNGARRRRSAWSRACSC